MKRRPANVTTEQCRAGGSISPFRSEVRAAFLTLPDIRPLYLLICTRRALSLAVQLQFVFGSEHATARRTLRFNFIDNRYCGIHFVIDPRSRVTSTV